METGFRTSGVAAGDFDRDGAIDLAFAVGEHWPRPALVFFNDGRGNFQERQRIAGRDQKGQAIGVVDFRLDSLPLSAELGGGISSKAACWRCAASSTFHGSPEEEAAEFAVVASKVAPCLV